VHLAFSRFISRVIYTFRVIETFISTKLTKLNSRQKNFDNGEGYVFAAVRLSQGTKQILDEFGPNFREISFSNAPI